MAALPGMAGAVLRPGDTWTGTVTLKGSWQENCNQSSQYETDVCSDEGSSSLSVPVTGVLEVLASGAYRLSLNGSGQATYQDVNHFDRTFPGGGTDCPTFHNNTDTSYEGSGSSALEEIQLTFQPGSTGETFSYESPVLDGASINVTETDSSYTDYYPPAANAMLGDCTQQPPPEQSTQTETAAGFPYPPGDVTTPTQMESFTDNPEGPTAVNGSLSWSQTVPGKISPTATETFTYTESWSLDGPPCPGVASARPGSSTGGEATLLEASTCGLTITSPPAKGIIAMTDEHYLPLQPGPADRQPKQRTLTVKGTAPTQSVTLNGLQVPVMGGEWEANLPITKLGQLTLNASDGHDNVQQTDTMIDVVITNPAEGKTEAVTPTPQMPPLNATVKVEGYSGDTKDVHFLWTLQLHGEYVDKAGYHPYPETIPATGSTMGTATAWKPNYTMMVGGVARLSIVATGLPTVHSPVVSEPRWFDIPGENPSKAAIMAFTKQKDPANADTLDHLFCHESNFEQFNPNRELREPPTEAIPADWPFNPGILRPLSGSQEEDFGADVGIAQANPAKFPTEQWNWHDNVERGIVVLHSGIKAAGEWRAQEQARLDSERKTALDQANGTRKLLGLQLINIDRIIVPALSPEQLKRFAIRKYNGGDEYRFSEHFVEVVTLDGPVVQTQGTNDWVDQAGTWEDVGKWEARGGVMQVRTWIPKNNPGYVDAVVNCKV